MSDKYINTNIPGFVKDPSSGAILNVSLSDLEVYKKQRFLKSKETERIEKIEDDINDIKKMLSILIERK